MEDINQRIEDLENSVNQLNAEQIRTTETLNMVLGELQSLKASLQTVTASPQAEVPFVRRSSPSIPTSQKQTTTATTNIRKDQLENLIGSNLINKIGILVTLIGVYIGAKYAIDKDLISPAMRIILGYGIASALCFLAYKLKAKYIDYSAVLMSGSISIIYFITYIAQSFYHLFTQPIAFGAMLATTVFVVSMSIWYNRKIIALLGQVGAYAIPFLLSTGNENLPVLYGYLSIINAGLLFLSFKRDWKIIYQVAFCTSWFIFLVSFLNAIDLKADFYANLILLFINFLIFYTAFLSHKIIKKELYNLVEIVILLTNAVAFYLLGYYLINTVFENEQYLTYFTLANALVHGALGFWIYRMKLADSSVSLFILGLGIAFITISVPVAFHGNTITVLWTIEALALCFIGYRTKREAYLMLTVALLILTLGSLVLDWYKHYLFDEITSADQVTPFLNANFLSSVFVCLCLGIISSLSTKNRIDKDDFINASLTIALPFVFVLSTYGLLVQEIDLAWFVHMMTYKGEELQQFRNLSLQLFSMAYISLWFGLNIMRFKAKHFSTVLVIIGVYALFIALVGGLTEIGLLRTQYLQQKSGNALSMLGFRYLYFLFIAILLTGITRSLKQFPLSQNSKRLSSAIFNLTLLSLLCNEFIHWMDIGGYTNQYKLGLSIIGGAYALVLIFVGIRKKQKHLRIGAMVLLGITLVKLFFYDLSSLSTISKTVVLLVLGMIMLMASFLYNKFKDSIFGNEAETNL